MNTRIAAPRGGHLAWVVTWLVAALLIAAAWGTVAELAQRDRQDALARAERDSGNLARIIAEQATRAISDTDRILNFLAYDIGRLGSDRPELHDILRNATTDSDVLLQLSFTDAKGIMLGSSVEEHPARVDISDREHFLVHKNGTVKGLFISKPVFGRASGKWSIQLSRRISAPDGSFAGIMVASLDPFYFSRTFSGLDVGKGGLVLIVGRDGVVRARTNLDDKTLGRDVSRALPMLAGPGQSHGFMRSVSPIDSVTRLLSYRTLAKYPLTVFAGFDEAEFMAQTQSLRRIYIGGASGVTAMLLALALLTTRHMRVQDRAREAAERANDLKSQFLTTISHEIRTPMNGVLGMLALLEGDNLTPSQKQQANLARRSAEGLLVLLDDILNFSKLEAGKSVADPGNCEPEKIIGAVIELLRPKAEEKGLRVDMHVGPTVPDVVVTDPTRLRQILFNLVGNAIKFTSSGQVSIRAQRGADLPDGRFMLEFEVEDTGIGIPPEVVPNLFRQFTQADSSITRSYGGTGLGLAISKRLCELLGGSISVSSTPGKGSVFWFSIAAAMGEAMPASEPTPAAASLPPLHILVVDDNVVNLQVVEGLLTRAGHRVHAVTGGQAALDAIQASADEKFDVVLMDVQMPEMDGLTATRLIRALPSPYGAVPVIALTAHASNSSRSVCIGAGMSGFVIKPANIARMQREIAAVLGLAAAQSSAVPAAVADALLDREQIAELVTSLPPDAWERVIASLSQSVEQEIGRIEAALDAGESPARPAHTLKGIAWNTGAARLGNIAKQIETAEPGEARRLVGELRAVAKETLAALAVCVPSAAEA
jgi:signal transduction histidine kinase/DNA-binding response OmpR family regulator